MPIPMRRDRGDRGPCPCPCRPGPPRAHRPSRPGPGPGPPRPSLIALIRSGFGRPRPPFVASDDPGFSLPRRCRASGAFLSSSSSLGRLFPRFLEACHRVSNLTPQFFDLGVLALRVILGDSGRRRAEPRRPTPRGRVRIGIATCRLSPFGETGGGPATPRHGPKNVDFPYGIQPLPRSLVTKGFVFRARIPRAHAGNRSMRSYLLPAGEGGRYGRMRDPGLTMSQVPRRRPIARPCPSSAPSGHLLPGGEGRIEATRARSGPRGRR